MSDDLAISVVGLRKTYDDKAAVDGVDLSIHRGECFALLGPNGAGKSTTVEILEGYRKRDAGEVSVLGVDPSKAGMEWRQRVGIVLQTTGEFDDLTVGEVVSHFSTFYTKGADPGEVIERVGLTEKTNWRTHKLSGGQKRRLDVALGIVGNPELLFLDEPTTGFDPQARREFWDLIRDLSAIGTTILLTTHYLDEAEALASRVGVIANGKMIEVGTPSELGGRNFATAKVSWRNAQGETRTTETDTPTAVVASLSASDFGGGEVPELTIHRPTLEDIYLTMIGANQ
ncbi:ABC-2 type transport system ATP-binding protein [Allocatelliglobosispora scoriae]|uniref:ABC-2 type transport system ATP-binding protein n=1 Tax=Allocatelliglobosispora scoriae TaxID=643052 RepID=A0A841BV30_9ACTN|nr:ABC transporter ATP-binding protein [Allocatelliglobosispora scoriae]MBB5872054.1 ABC-2 type transport system ATP-binding protein [Allocatelliglobosispora scoriae]